MTLTPGALGTIAALALLLSLIAVAVALTNRRQPALAMPGVPAEAERTPAKPEAPALPTPDKASAPAPVAAEAPVAVAPAPKLPEGISKITPTPADDEITAVIAAAITAYLDAEGGSTGAAAVTNVTNVGSTGAPWSAAGRQTVIESRQTMYGKGYRR